MTARDLRIGNMLHYFNGEKDILIQVGYIDATSDLIVIEDYAKCVFNIKELKPIKLTHDWLIMLGFEKNKLLDYYWKKFGATGAVLVAYDESYQGYLFLLGQGLNKVLTNVHELMNLYYDLVGEELILVVSSETLPSINEALAKLEIDYSETAKQENSKNLNK